MSHQIFISYPAPNEEIVENLAGRLRELGVAPWVYSIDRTLAEDLWAEIEAKVQGSELFLFVASRFSKDAQGQHRGSQGMVEPAPLLEALTSRWT